MEEKNWLAWDWAKGQFVPASEVNKKQKTPLWTSEKERPTYLNPTKKPQKEELVPLNHISLGNISESMEGLLCVVWCVQSSEWLTGKIVEVYTQREAFLFAVIETERGWFKAYALDQLMIAKNQEQEEASAA